VIKNSQQLENTLRKLTELESHYREREQDTPSHVRDLTLRSLKKTMNQLKEEIAVFEAHHPTVS
jgi:hypothetical protein